MLSGIRFRSSQRHEAVAAGGDSSRRETQSCAGEAEWWQRLEKYVTSLVQEAETKLEVYWLVLEGKRQESAPLSATVGGGLGEQLGLLLELPFSDKLLKVIGELAAEKLHAASRRRKLNGVSRLAYLFSEQRKDLRRMLVEAGLHAFRSYERQVMGAYSDAGWQPAVKRLGEDAAHRALHYCSWLGREVHVTIDVITRGIVEGKSKRENRYTLNRGFSIRYGSADVTTKDVYDKVGLVILDSEQLSEVYYTKRNDKSSISKYEYRLLFRWECDGTGHLDKQLERDYQAENVLSEDKYRYVFKTENIPHLVDEIFDTICSTDNSLTEERIKKVIADMKDDMLSEIRSYLEQFTRKQGDDYIKIIEELKKVKKMLERVDADEYSAQLQALVRAQQEGMLRVAVEADLTREMICEQNERMGAENSEDHKKTRALVEKVLTRVSPPRPYWPVRFQLREPVRSFTGRQEQLEILREALQRQGGERMVVVSGLGGVGKSELARHYAVHSGDAHGHNAVWIHAESYDSIHRSFKGLARLLGVDTEEQVNGRPVERDISHMLGDIYNMFEDKQSLFIFDNAQKYRNQHERDEGLMNFLPKGRINKPSIIITSCMDDWDPMIQKIKLKIFKESETLTLLNKLLGESLEKQHVAQLGKLVHHLPLALQMSSAYIKSESISINEYIVEYNQKTSEILHLNFPEGSGDNYTRTVFNTWQVTLDKILTCSVGVEAITVLNIMAYMNPDSIIKDMFSELYEKSKIRQAINTLAKYSIISQEPSMPQLQVHKLVQDVIRSKVRDSQKEATILGQALDLLKDKLVESDVSYMDALVQQAEVIWDCASKYVQLIEHHHDILPSILRNAKHLHVLTPVTYAAQRGQVYVMKHFKMQGVDIHRKDDMRKSPLHRAAQARRLEMVKYLIDVEDANVNIRDRNGRTPLYTASRVGDNLKVVRYLIQKTAEVTDVSRCEDWQLLKRVADENREDIVKYLIEKSDADPKYLQKDLLLCHAAQDGNLDIVTYLIDNGADVLFIRNGVTVLHEAVFGNNVKVIELILSRVAMVLRNTKQSLRGFLNHVDRPGDTALMWAAKACQKNTVRILLKHKADISIKNEKNLTALDLAEQSVGGLENKEEAHAVVMLLRDRMRQSQAPH